MKDKIKIIEMFSLVGRLERRAARKCQQAGRLVWTWWYELCSHHM